MNGYQNALAAAMRPTHKRDKGLQKSDNKLSTGPKKILIWWEYELAWSGKYQWETSPSEDENVNAWKKNLLPSTLLQQNKNPQIIAVSVGGKTKSEKHIKYY